ncbi:MAG: hypothetical protein ABW125_07255, partial [Candidatus Thiodiazotropha lotti]
ALACLVEPAVLIRRFELSQVHVGRFQLGWRISTQLKMAHFEGETSNRLLETLEEWNEFLEKYAPYFKEVA